MRPATTSTTAANLTGVQTRREVAGGVTLTRHDELAAIGCAQVWPAEGECVLAPVLLRARHCTRALTCGLALLRTREPLRPAPAADLLDALGQALLCDAAISGVSEAG